MNSSEFLRSTGREVYISAKATSILLGASTVIAFSIGFVLLYVDRKRRFDQLWSIPGSMGNPFLVSFAVAKAVIKRDAMKSNVISFQAICGITTIFPKAKIVRFWLFFRPVVVMLKPEAIEAVLGSNDILEKSFAYEFLGPWFKSGLITSKGPKWRQRRKILTPSFHFRILDDFIPVIDYHSHKLIENLREKVGKQPFDIVYWVTLCSLDTLCETAMGKRINAQVNSDAAYLKALRRASEIFFSRITKPWQWPETIFKLCPEGKVFQQCVDIMTNFTRNEYLAILTMAYLKAQPLHALFLIVDMHVIFRGENGKPMVILERKQELMIQLNRNIANKETQNFNYTNSKKKQAFLDLLLHLHIYDGSMSEEDIREEVDTFMFAGHDTTAVGMSWTLYLLGLYPEVQYKVQQEIDGIFFGDKERAVTSEDLKQLKYLECVIKESQRLYPSLPLIGREIRKDTVVDGYKIPSGTSCLLATYILHRNPETFPDPEVFDPDRFLPENCLGRHPYAYIPFSAGPRNCIGQRFAMMELKAVIAHVLRNFNIHSVEKRDKLHLTAEMVLRSAQGLYVTLENRSGTEYMAEKEVSEKPL